MTGKKQAVGRRAQRRRGAARTNAFSIIFPKGQYPEWSKCKARGDKIEAGVR